MQSNYFNKIESSRGYVLLMVVGVVAISTAIVFGTFALKTEAMRQERTKNSQDGMMQAKAFVLDYLRQHKVLPDASAYSNGTSTLKDAWGRKLLYFPSSNFLTGDACLVSATNISIKQCGNDVACSTPIVTANIPFLILSGGEYSKFTTDPVYQSTQHTDSASITTAESFKQYRDKLEVGSYAAPSDVNTKAIYDDIVLSASLPEIYDTAGCLLKTQGDVQNSGGIIKLLNKNVDPLPVASCPSTYSKSFVAYGRTGSYSWSIPYLPSGLTAASSVTNSITITGVPNVTDGTYPIVVIATDSAGKSDSKTYQLPISGCCNWGNTGVTQQLACASATFTGSITQFQQTRCDGTTQWISVDSCVAASIASFDGRFSELIGAGAFQPDSFDSGSTELVLGSGASEIKISASSNLSRHSLTSGNPAIGVIGGTNAIDAGETINVDFTGGYGRKLGIEFRGLQNDKGSGADKKEEAIIVFKDSNAGTTIATYTVKACRSGSTASSYFSLPDVGAPFNRIEVTANNSPAATDFYIRGVKTCDVGAASCQPLGSSNFCAYP